jgi:hypothetical protein
MKKKDEKERKTNRRLTVQLPISAANDGTGIPPSEIPALNEIPLTTEDERRLLACVHSMDTTLAKRSSIRLRVELAATILAGTCGAAYDTAEAGSRTAELRYDECEELVVARAHELFEITR